MLNLQKAYIAWQKVDDYALQNHLLSEVDPRVHLILTFLFVFVIVLAPPHQPEKLLLFLPYIIVEAKLIGMSLFWLVKRVLLILPFVLLIGVFSPWMERAQQFEVMGYSLSVGWLTLMSITLRALLCVSFGLLLLSSCGMIGITEGLKKLRFPRAFYLTLYFIYGYFSLILQEMAQVQKAYLLRKLSKNQRFEWRDYQEVLKVFFIRVWNRSNSTYQAMQCRNFRGELHRHKTYSHSASFAWFGLSSVYLITCYLLY